MFGIIFSLLVTIVIIGWLWFYIARPILEDYGILGERVVTYYDVDNPRIMSRSSSVDDRTSSVPVVPVMVRSDTNAESTSSDSESVPVHEPAQNLRVMSEIELIAWLSVVRTPDGKYRFTANDIAKTVGGTRADVLDMVAELRPKPANEAPARNKKAATFRRPKNGWSH